MKKIYALLFVCIVAFPFFSNEASAAIIDEVEPNDTSNDAQLIERNNHNPAQMLVGDNSSQKVLVGNLVSNLDVDWYKMTLLADPKTILSINNKAFHSRWDVHLQGNVSNVSKPYSLTPILRFSYFYPIIP